MWTRIVGCFSPPPIAVDFLHVNKDEQCEQLTFWCIFSIYYIYQSFSLWSSDSILMSGCPSVNLCYKTDRAL